MLTAIVVAVATLGVALSLIIKIYREYSTLEEDEILPQISDKYDSQRRFKTN
jgi:multicomponent Na+:H+ antiporter subunit C